MNDQSYAAYSCMYSLKIPLLYSEDNVMHFLHFSLKACLAWRSAAAYLLPYFPACTAAQAVALLRRCSVQTLVLMRVLNPRQGHPSVGKTTWLIQNSVIEFSTPHARVNYRRLLCVLFLLCYCLGYRCFHFPDGRLFQSDPRRPCY